MIGGADKSELILEEGNGPDTVQRMISRSNSDIGLALRQGVQHLLSIRVPEFNLQAGELAGHVLQNQREQQGCHRRHGYDPDQSLNGIGGRFNASDSLIKLAHLLEREFKNLFSQGRKAVLAFTFEQPSAKWSSSCFSVIDTADWVGRADQPAQPDFRSAQPLQKHLSISILMVTLQFFLKLS